MARRLKKTRLYKKMLKYGKKLARNRLLDKTLPEVYREAATQPVDESKVIFAEGKLSKMPDAFTLMWDWLELRYDFNLSYITLRQNTVKYREYERNCEDFVREIATASVVFLNDASDVISCLPLRPETKVVQLWHACGAFKKWGMSTADLKFGGSRKALLRHPFYKNLDVVTVSSPEVEWAYREAMVLDETPDVVQPLGVSRTDVFFDEGFLACARQRVELYYPECKGRKIVLYAPTFRGHVKGAKSPDQLDVAAMCESLSDEYVLLVKHHPFVKRPPEIPGGCERFAFTIGNRLPIEVLLAAADVCLTDYSSIVFEFSLFERPIGFFSPDLTEYDDWRGFYYDYSELTPGPVFTENAGLVDWLLHLDERFGRQQVADFRERFMSACDGHATERIARVAFGDALETHRVRDVTPALVENDPEGKDVSIVVPAYNAELTLPRALDSVLAQTYSLDRIEVVVVDDCSPDGTYAVAQDYAERYRDTFVVAQTPSQSGSPSEPRNIGLGLARGTYVFFMDADDWLGEQAVLKMLDHAVEWDSDVLAVKMRGRGGRAVPMAMFDKNYPSCDIYQSKLMWTFSPLKLFRRTFVQHLRFPDFMPEDISFVLRALVEAKTVSVASDYDYYNVAYAKGSGENISLTTWDDVESNLRAYEDVFGFISDNVPVEERERVLLRRIIRRDVLHTFLTIARSDDGRSASWYDRLVGIVAPHYSPGVYLTCPPEKRVILDAALLWGHDALRTVARYLDKGQADAYSFMRYDVRERDEDEKPQITSYIALDGAQYECQVGRAMRLSGFIEHADWDEEGALDISGTMAGSHLFLSLQQDFTPYIMARNISTKEEIRWPCTIDWHEARFSIDEDYPARGTWSAAISALDVIQPAPEEAPPDYTRVDESAQGFGSRNADGPAASSLSARERAAAAADAALQLEAAAKACAGVQALPEHQDAGDIVLEDADEDDLLKTGASGDLVERADDENFVVDQGAREGAIEKPREITWYLYLVLEAEGMVKTARLSYEIVSDDHPWGDLTAKIEGLEGRKLILRGRRAGNFAIVERILPAS